MADQAWATVEDVAAVTGQTIEAAWVERAQAALETISGVLLTAETWEQLGVADRRWLRNAVVYQAVFMVASPDYFERQDVASASADGQSATFRRDAATLSPMARKALRKLSWRGSRVVHLPGVAASPLVDADDRLPWRPL